MSGHHHFENGGPERWLSRAVMLETTTAYLSQTQDAPDPLDQTHVWEKKQWKLKHLAHQFRRTPQTAVTEILAQMPVITKTMTEMFENYVTNAPCPGDSPRNYQRSPFVQLTYASEFDRALEYQPLVVRELAQKGYEYDLNSVANIDARFGETGNQ
eukprot:2842512-Amphidinium_carterae.4